MGRSWWSWWVVGREEAMKVSSQGWERWAKGMLRIVGVWVDLRGMDIVGSEELSPAGCCSDLHHAIRLTISSHSSKLTTSRKSGSSASFPFSCFGWCPGREVASSFNISCPSHLLALIDRNDLISLYSYTPVTVVSAHPMSTMRAARKPAANVLRMGEESSDIVGG